MFNRLLTNVRNLKRRNPPSPLLSEYVSQLMTISGNAQADASQIVSDFAPDPALLATSHDYAVKKAIEALTETYA